MVTDRKEGAPLVKIIGFQAIAVRSEVSSCVERHCVKEEIQKNGMRLMVAGPREFILDTLRSAVVFAQISGEKRPQISVATADDSGAACVADRFPALGLVADVSFIRCDPSNLGWNPALKGQRFDACFLGWPDETLTLAGGNQLARSALCEVIEVLAFVNGAPQGDIDMVLPDNMRLVSVFEGGARAIENGFLQLELEAKSQREAYLNTLKPEERAERERKGEDFSWEGMPELKKESNRVAVLHGTIKKKIWESVQDAGEKALESTLESLSVSEHSRWMAEKVMDGFVYGAETVSRRRIHRDLRPWGELSVSDKDKDRNQVRKVLGLPLLPPAKA